MKAAGLLFKMPKLNQVLSRVTKWGGGGGGGGGCCLGLQNGGGGGLYRPPNV